MTDGDLAYIETLITEKILMGPALELGAGYGGHTCKTVIKDAGLSYFTSVIVPSQGIDFVANFEFSSVADAFAIAPKFGTVLILNVLEHTFNPIGVLDNARSLLVNGGRLVVITPAVWTLHEYPIDCYRLLPQWYEEYASRRQLELPRQYFKYIGLDKIDAYKDSEGRHQFSSPCRNMTI